MTRNASGVDGFAGVVATIVVVLNLIIMDWEGSGDGTLERGGGTLCSYGVGGWCTDA